MKPKPMVPMSFEGARSPSVVTQADGTFIFRDVDPADYVMAVGELMGDHVMISESNGKARIFAAEKGKTLDVGTLKVDLGN